MHLSAMNNCKSFFQTYAEFFPSDKSTKVVEIGSQDVNGSLRSVAPDAFDYIGVDFQAAKGVDVVLTDPYSLPFASESVDMVLSSSCFEHSEMFWLVFLEIMRVLKPRGLFYLNVPSAGSFHRYPVDCWRFYPDSGRALVQWSKRSGGNAELLESYTQKGGTWQDFVGVFVKDRAFANAFPKRIVSVKTDFENGTVSDSKELINMSSTCQNDKKLLTISQIVSDKLILK
jgi:SAM-dependent methyltransferase